jgi:hypothetical protein
VFVVTPRPHFLPAVARYPLNRRLGGLQGCAGWVRKIPPSPGFDPRNVQPAANERSIFSFGCSSLIYGTGSALCRCVPWNDGNNPGVSENSGLRVYPRVHTVSRTMLLYLKHMQLIRVGRAGRVKKCTLRSICPLRTRFDVHSTYN